MINLSYRFDQNSISIRLEGIPDVSNGDSDNTIGILTSWSLQIIGSPLLEGKKEHLDNLMHVILQYSRSYISGIKRSFKSSENLVCLSPLDGKHKLLLNSTQKNIKPLEIILDDSELSDLTRCIDILRFDKRININWNLEIDQPYRRKYLTTHLNSSKNNTSFIYGCLCFVISSFLLYFIPITKNSEPIDNNRYLIDPVEEIK